jgi:hypothetical protein
MGCLFYDLSVGPRIASHVQEQRGSDFQNVKQAAHQRNAGHSRPALPHFYTQLGDLKTAAMQQENHLGLRIIVGIPVRERLDHPPIDHSKTTGAISDRNTAQQADERAQNTDADRSTDRLFVFSFAEKSRADHHVCVGAQQVIDQAVYLTGAMLAIAVDLHGNVISMQGRIPISSLHRPTDAQVEWQTHHRTVSRHLAKSVIGGAVVDDEYIKIGQRAVQAMSQFPNGLPLVKGWHNHQTADVGMC